MEIQNTAAVQNLTQTGSLEQGQKTQDVGNVPVGEKSAQTKQNEKVADCVFEYRRLSLWVKGKKELENFREDFLSTIKDKTLRKAVEKEIKSEDKALKKVFKKEIKSEDKALKKVFKKEIKAREKDPQIHWSAAGEDFKGDFELQHMQDEYPRHAIATPPDMSNLSKRVGLPGLLARWSASLVFKK
jgi:hypothetical protein